MKCSSLSLSGKEWETFVNPRNAKTSMTIDVNRINHCQGSVEGRKSERVVSISPAVDELACHKLVSESGGSALRPSWPCAGNVEHSYTSDQQTNLP